METTDGNTQAHLARTNRSTHNDLEVTRNPAKDFETGLGTEKRWELTRHHPAATCKLLRGPTRSDEAAQQSGDLQDLLTDADAPTTSTRVAPNETPTPLESICK